MRRVLLIALLAAIAAMAMSASAASANTITAECNGGGAGSCNPWFNVDVNLHWDITPDPTPPGCPDPATFTAETADTLVQCTANWPDPDTQTVSAHIKTDKTDPTVTGANADISANTAGWFNAPVTFHFTGSDGLSGISGCTTAPAYSGPDSASASVSGTCTDNATNVSASTPHGFKFDDTPPTVTGATATGATPNAAGWFRSPVSWAFDGTDATSGKKSCQAVGPYSGPDSASASVNGTCTDNADNTSAPTAKTFKYDSTAPSVNVAPSRAADHGIWYTAPVTFSWGGADATSGLATSTCTPNNNFSTETASQVLSGSCSDAAGNSATASVTVHYDTVAPTAAVNPSRPADSGIWWNHPVTFTWSGTDATSGIQACSTPVNISTNTLAAGQTLAGSCTDNAGHTTNAQTTVHYDNVAPTNNGGSPDRSADVAGWYNHAVGITFAGADSGVSGFAGCDNLSYTGPDGAGVTPTGNCRSNAGMATPAQSTAFNYDGTPPTVVLSPDRAPDHAGWYTHPVTFTVHGSDATSGLVSCRGGGTYGGPDTAGTGVAASCLDVAGNTGATSVGFRYDATPPGAPTLFTRPGKRKVRVSWNVPRDVASVVVTRTVVGKSVAPAVVYSGAHTSVTDAKLKNGTRYRYTVTDLDAAGNSASATTVAVPTTSSLRPFAETVLTAAPLLKWKKSKTADYYNVQLYRDGKKIWSTWPRRNFLQIRQAWAYAGTRYTFVAGHYKWYVWPGYGARSRHRYGHAIGSSSFNFGVLP